MLAAGFLFFVGIIFILCGLNLCLHKVHRIRGWRAIDAVFEKRIYEQGDLRHLYLFHYHDSTGQKRFHRAWTLSAREFHLGDVEPARIDDATGEVALERWQFSCAVGAPIIFFGLALLVSAAIIVAHEYTA